MADKLKQFDAAVDAARELSPEGLIARRKQEQIGAGKHDTTVALEEILEGVASDAENNAA